MGQDAVTSPFFLHFRHRLSSFAGHVQIAQVPQRHEPDSPGELSFPYLFQLLESMNYSGYVGCEYAPKGKPVVILMGVGKEGVGTPYRKLTMPIGSGNEGCMAQTAATLSALLSTSERADPKLQEAHGGCLDCTRLMSLFMAFFAGATLQGLGWLYSYWETHGLQHGGS